jgi:hypothetical protein
LLLDGYADSRNFPFSHPTRERYQRHSIARPGESHAPLPVKACSDDELQGHAAVYPEAAEELAQRIVTGHGARNVELEEVLPRWQSGPEKGRPDRLTVHTAGLAAPPVVAQQFIEALLVAA